jgi:hypothetical protein
VRSSSLAETAGSDYLRADRRPEVELSDSRTLERAQRGSGGAERQRETVEQSGCKKASSLLEGTQQRNFPGRKICDYETRINSDDLDWTGEISGKQQGKSSQGTSFLIAFADRTSIQLI